MAFHAKEGGVGLVPAAQQPVPQPTELQADKAAHAPEEELQAHARPARPASPCSILRLPSGAVTGTISGGVHFAVVEGSAEQAPSRQVPLDSGMVAASAIWAHTGSSWSGDSRDDTGTGSFAGASGDWDEGIARLANSLPGENGRAHQGGRGGLGGGHRRHRRHSRHHCDGVSAQDKILVQNQSPAWALVRDIPAHLSATVRRIVRVERYQPRERLAPDGHAPRKSWFVVAGCISAKLPVSTPEEEGGWAYRVARYGPGEAFGELTWPGQEAPKAYGYVADEATIALTISHQQYWSLLYGAREQEAQQARVAVVSDMLRTAHAQSSFKQPEGASEEAIRANAMYQERLAQERADESDALERFARMLTVQIFKRGESVVQQGAATASVYIVCSGECRLDAQAHVRELFPGSSKIPFQGPFTGPSLRPEDPPAGGRNKSWRMVHSHGLSKPSGKGGASQEIDPLETSGDLGSLLEVLSHELGEEGEEEGEQGEHWELILQLFKDRDEGRAWLPLRAPKTGEVAKADEKNVRDALKVHQARMELMLENAAQARAYDSRATTLALASLTRGNCVGEILVWGGYQEWPYGVTCVSETCEVAAIGVDQFLLLPDCIALKLFESAIFKVRYHHRTAQRAAEKLHSEGWVLDKSRNTLDTILPLLLRSGAGGASPARAHELSQRLKLDVRRREGAPSARGTLVRLVRKNMRDSLGIPEDIDARALDRVHLFQVTCKNNASLLRPSAQRSESTAPAGTHQEGAGTEGFEGVRPARLPPDQLRLAHLLFASSSIDGQNRHRPSTSQLSTPRQLTQAERLPHRVVPSLTEMHLRGPRNASVSSRPYHHLHVPLVSDLRQRQEGLPSPRQRPSREGSLFFSASLNSPPLEVRGERSSESVADQRTRCGSPWGDANPDYYSNQAAQNEAASPQAGKGGQGGSSSLSRGASNRLKSAALVNVEMTPGGGLRGSGLQASTPRTPRTRLSTPSTPRSRPLTQGSSSTGKATPWKRTPWVPVAQQVLDMMTLVETRRLSGMTPRKAA